MMENYNNVNGFIKKTILIVLIIIILTPSFSMANYNMIKDLRVYQLGIMSNDSASSKNHISRGELATIAVRLMNLEHLKNSKGNFIPFKDVSGWALPYVKIANDYGLMRGVSNSSFHPNENLSYVEVLTVIMRVLGYKDRIDFKTYPDNYYSKAIEIGLANLYIPYDQIVTREIVAQTINKALDLKVKDTEIQLVSTLSYNYTTVVNYVDNDLSQDTKVYVDDINFNTNILGMFSGLLKAPNPKNYKVTLLSNSGSILKTTSINDNGSFSIEDFDISILTKLQGYKYEVYSLDGSLVLLGNLN